jgi:bacteriocin biosynthesis cyclodehydratase domain-containing protein
VTSGFAPLAGYVLNPAARVLWRSTSCIQLELGRRAVMLEGIDPAAIRALTGQKADGEPVSTSAAKPFESALGPLAAAGFLIPPNPDAPSIAVPRLAADLTALHVRHGHHAERILAVRRSSFVMLRGTGRTLPVVGALLAAAGVGHVAVHAEGDAALEHAAPGGLLPDDEGFRYAAAAAGAIRRAAPECDTGPVADDRGPDLVVLSADQPLDTDIREGLHARSVPHLMVAGGADSGVVGPLVRPGRTSCLRCADLHRGDRDRAWPAFAVQLAQRPRHPAADDVILASVLGALAAAQALAHLDGDNPATIDGTLEVQPPHWTVRRRGWAPHPACRCGSSMASLEPPGTMTT